MQAKIGATTAETASLLENFGIELSTAGLVVMTDFAKAESAYIHHSMVPVAVVAIAIASPVFARMQTRTAFAAIATRNGQKGRPNLNVKKCLRKRLAEQIRVNIDDLPPLTGARHENYG